MWLVTNYLGSSTSLKSELCQATKIHFMANHLRFPCGYWLPFGSQIVIYSLHGESLVLHRRCSCHFMRVSPHYLDHHFQNHLFDYYTGIKLSSVPTENFMWTQNSHWITTTKQSPKFQHPSIQSCRKPGNGITHWLQCMHSLRTRLNKQDWCFSCQHHWTHQNFLLPSMFNLWKSQESYKHAVLVVLDLTRVTQVPHPVQLSSQAHKLPKMPVWLCWADHGGEQKEHLGANPSLPSILHMGFQLHGGGALHIPSDCSTGLSGLCCLQSPEPAPWGLVGLQAATASMEPGASLGRLVFAASSLTWLILQEKEKLWPMFSQGHDAT